MDNLKQLGFNRYEISIYETLISYSVLDAKKISTYSKVPQTAVYPNLKSLISKGLVQEIIGKIKTYIALDPKLSIPSYIEKKKSELDLISAELKDKLTTLEKNTSEDKSHILSVSRGVESSHEIYFDMFSKTKKTLFLVGWGFIVKKNMYKMMHELITLNKKGVDVRMIVTSNKEKDAIKMHKLAGINIRYLNLQNISLAVSDRTICKITLKNPSIGDRYNIHVTDSDLANAMADYFLTLWNKAKK
jgi:sugar-specific transcriptional regulator TrmB